MSTIPLREQALALVGKYREFAALGGELLTLELRQVMLRVIALVLVAFVASWFGVGMLVCLIVGVIAHFVFATADIAHGFLIAAGIQLLCALAGGFFVWRLGRKVDLPLTRRYVFQALAPQRS